MSFELTYIKDEVTYTRTVEPLGNFSLETTKDNHRYREELSGEMTFKNGDFDWIMEAGACTEIRITCTFKHEWRGIFTHTDCATINLSKKYLEVTPRPDDEYSKFLPWMRLEMNIIPEYNGIDSRVPVYTYNQYEIETRVVRIDDPYDGPNSENWIGYSVNDFIVTNGVIPANPYRGDNGHKNSLIRRLIGSIAHFSTISDADAWNRIAWIDTRGYELHSAGLDLADLSTGLQVSYWRESMFTLAEVINYYTEEDPDTWEYCELIYKRETYKGRYLRSPSGYGYEMPPPSGLNFDPSVVNSESDTINILTGRWIWNVAEKKWIRRYLGMHQRGGIETPEGEPDNLKTGDGFDYTPLIQTIQNDRVVRKQVLFRNKYEEEDYGANWYGTLYDFVILYDLFHKPELIIQKFIKFIKDKGATTTLTSSDISSSFFTSENNPYSGSVNIWKDVLIGQNSDVKRPLATENATREMISFEQFLNTLCELSNCGWAIIGGQLVIEHTSYFDRGLSYGTFAPASSILNPYSIENVAKNKGYLELTDIYSYDKPNMPKFEIYKTEGGEEPKNNNVKIEYTVGCINNLPDENTREITIDTTTDYEWTRIEGGDAGITFIQTDIFDYLGIPTNRFIPLEDEYGRYVYNRDFTLEQIVEEYHNWGRNYTEALLNREEWTGLQPFKNVLQNVSFPYKIASPAKMVNPYVLIITGLGYGQIRRMQYNTKNSWIDYELGLFPIEDVIPPETTMDWHIHNQTSDSDTWDVIHEMNTVFIMRPVVFDTDGVEIEYDSFQIVNPNTFQIKFTAAVIGQAHFIAMNVAEANLHTSSWLNASSVTIDHNLGRDVDELALSCIYDLNGYEIQPNSIEYISDNSIDIEFTSPISGSVAVADITGGYITNVYSTTISGTDTADLTRTANRVYNKPIVLEAGQEIFYNSHQLLTTLRRIGFSENVIATIIVMEKTKD